MRPTVTNTYHHGSVFFCIVSSSNTHSTMVPGDIFRVHFSWEHPQGCIIPRPHGSVPAACIPFAYVFSLPCRGRPSGCIIPKPLGPDPVACIFLHLPKLICFPCLTSLRLSPARSSPPTGPSHRHGAGAWVRPCHVDEPERSSSGSRYAPRTSPHQALSAFTSSRATSGRLAAVTANYVSACACSQGSHGKDSRRHRESLSLSCNSLAR